MNTPNANIPEIENNIETDASPSSTEVLPFNMKGEPVTEKVTSTGNGGTGAVTLTEADIQPLPDTRVDDFADAEVKKEPTLEEVRAEAAARVGQLLDTNPLTNDELAQFTEGGAPQDWAESLTKLKLALGDLEDAIPTKNRARVVDAVRRLKHNQEELSRFLRVRGLNV